MPERRFPVLFQGSRKEIKALKDAGCPKTVPWAFIESLKHGCKVNHGQTVERLAQRGGLAPDEIIALTKCDEPYSERRKIYILPADQSVPMMLQLIKDWEAKIASP